MGDLAMRENRLVQLWKQGKTVVNAWLTIPSSWSAEVMAHAGFDSLTIDMQHGLADYQTALAMLQAISTTDVVPLARVPWNDPAIIMRLLDAGVYGIICPMINSRAEAQAFVGACRYPPAGYRSYGPIRALTYAGEDYASHANETVITLAMIETAQALKNLDDILSTPGLDGLYIGPADLSMGLGLADLANFQNPELLRALDTILNAAARHNVIPGIHANTPENAILLSERGFRFVTPANDTVLLRAAAKTAVGQTRKGLNLI
jgi:4-hydroxy-2-oxoheptanedioate aldolase